MTEQRSTHSRLPRHATTLLGAMVLLMSCDKLAGMDDVPTPLVQVHVKVKGDVTALRPAAVAQETPRLRVALVWGQQYLAESFCWVSALALDPSASAVAEAGCRDPLGFVPQMVGADAPVDASGQAIVDVLFLPSAAVMVGEVTGRIAYASLVVYDDRNANGVLDLLRGKRLTQQGPGGDGPQPSEDVTPTAANAEKNKVDFIYGASFVTMAQPDKRIAYREGTYDDTSFFYPRKNCPPPPDHFSVLGAGGFSIFDALAALSQLALPDEVTASCSAQTIDQAVIEIALQATETVRDVACCAAGGGGSKCGSGGTAGTTTYTSPLPTLQGPMAPKVKPPNLKLPWLCQSTKPKGGKGFGGGTGMPPKDPGPENFELVVPDQGTDCKSLTHYILVGCQTDANCKNPVSPQGWDWRATPPAWWPCPIPK